MFIGKECSSQGLKLLITSVGFINRTTAECFMKCAIVNDKQIEKGNSIGDQRDAIVVPLADCIQSINLRDLSTLGSEAKSAEPPLTVSDTAKLVEAMTERLALVHSIPMATKELKKRTPAGFLITVTPPPRRHMIFKSNTASDPENLLNSIVKRNKSDSTEGKTENINIQDREQIKFPITDGLRGVSTGEIHFRKKCSRHAVQYTRCRCVLPMTSTPAHVEALKLALTPVYIRPSSADADSTNKTQS